MASPPSVGVGLGWTLRSEGRSMAPVRAAKRRTSGVATSAAPALAPKTIRYGITQAPLLRSVRREPLAQCADPLPCVLLHLRVVGVAQHLADDARHFLHLRLVHAERGRAGSADPDPARLERRERVERDGVLVDGDPDVVAE